jgi:hypothetical protein
MPHATDSATRDIKTLHLIDTTRTVRAVRDRGTHGPIPS